MSERAGMDDAGTVRLFDRQLMTERRRRRHRDRSLAASDFLYRAAAEELADRLSVTQRDFAIALDIDDPSGHLAERLADLANVGTVVAMSPHAELLAPTSLGFVGDEEALALAPASLDLVVSNLSLHLTNDTPGTLIQIRRALKPDGLFSAALLGGDSLTELRQSLLHAETETVGGASPRVAPFPDIRDMGGLLQRAGFALPVTDMDRLTVRYDSLFALGRDLRQMGLSNMLSERSRRPLRRETLLRAAEIYAERFADADGRVRATFEIVYLSGWVPHESQQKPLRPGSAKASLKDALSPGNGS
ncbi:Methyltransferase domain-containing protein [Fulvimarina manganoxydans]|uniref:Methyltransferase domain-containing protein n=1 Tax=Fulvimarina manganoxydans TaxID=937218 RepID=A0A1W1YCP8_9HYPH|nr:methyltransferase domain-containing protein [Fulvimarina manganoxydans]SMC33894.1 Methyltransferase domain-containing protein [Fulvimarina manganoxydans]